jgi:putative membrane protein
MSPEVQAYASGFPVTLLHAATSLFIWILGVAVYAVLSPGRELGLIREGSSAATLSFAGAVLGLAIPLAVSLTASASLIEIALWGVSLVFVQLGLFRLLDALLWGVPARVREGETVAAVLLTGARLGSALILAAAVAG